MKVQVVFITIITVLCFSSSIAEAISPGWSEPVQITTHWMSDFSPTLIQDENDMYWVAWRSSRQGPDGDIWMSNSTDGINWSVPIMITDDDTNDYMPSLIQDSNGTFWLVSMNSSSSSDILIQNSSDGINWNAPIPVVADGYKDYWPSLMQDSNGTFWVVWESQDRGANNDIYYATSGDGINWSVPVNIPTNATYWDYVPDIAQDSNGTYWLTWTCGYDSNDNLCISNSTDGSNWSAPNEIVIGGEWRPDLLHSNELYWLVWGKASPDDDLYYSTSIDGIDWSAKVKVTTNTSGDRSPLAVTDSNGTIWIAWQSERTGWDIYITHSTVTLTSPLGGVTWNGTQNITWASVSSDYQNDTFNLYYSTDGASWILINSSIPADGAYTNKSYEWNTSNVSDSGNYTIKIVRVHPLHNESNVSGIFSINNVDTEPPEVTGIVPADGACVGGMQYINATVVDVISGVSSVVANVSNGSWSKVYVLSSGSGNVWYNDSWNTTQQAEGIYNISINATDSLGYSNDTEYVAVTVDNTPPGITIVSPASTTYSTSSIDLNYSVSEATSWEAYSLDGKANKTGGNQTLYGLSNGSHYVTAWVKDAAGNLNSSTVYFQVDINGANVTVGENYTEGTNITYGDNVSITAGDNVTAGSNITYADDSNVTFDDNVTIGDSTIIEGTVSVPPSTIISSYAKLTDGSKVQAQAGKKVNVTYTEGVTVRFVEIPEVAHKIVDLIRDFNVSAVSASVPGLIEVADNDTTPDFGITIAANGSVSATVEIAECEINPEKGSNDLASLRGNYLYINASEIANKTNITIRMKYSSGLVESSVKIYKFNLSSNTWAEQSSWRSGGYVYTNVSGFSVYGVAGETYTAPSSGGGSSGVSTKIFMLANSIDFNLSLDFTAYMTSKGVKVEYLNASNFTKYKKMRNIVILGGPDADEGVGEIVQEVLNENEQAEVRARDSEMFYMKENVWTGYQRVFILAGSDRWSTREASIDNMATVKSRLR